MPSPFQRLAASCRRSTSGALTLTTIFFSKSEPAFISRNVWVGRAKQLWLTTPFAMKSPVPVVISNMRTAVSSGSTDTTWSGASPLIAMPSMSRLRVMAGSTVKKKRRISRSPPNNLT